MFLMISNNGLPSLVYHHDNASSSGMIVNTSKLLQDYYSYCQNVVSAANSKKNSSLQRMQFLRKKKKNVAVTQVVAPTAPRPRQQQQRPQQHGNCRRVLVQFQTDAHLAVIKRVERVPDDCKASLWYTSLEIRNFKAQARAAAIAEIHQTSRRQRNEQQETEEDEDEQRDDGAVEEDSSSSSTTAQQQQERDHNELPVMALQEEEEVCQGGHGQGGLMKEDSTMALTLEAPTSSSTPREECGLSLGAPPVHVVVMGEDKGKSISSSSSSIQKNLVIHSALHVVIASTPALVVPVDNLKNLTSLVASTMIAVVPVIVVWFLRISAMSLVVLSTIDFTVTLLSSGY